MTVTSREGIAIAQLIYYVPALPVAIFVAVKHGFSRQGGWVFLILLSLLRIIGGATGIAEAISPSTGLFIATIITSSIGLSPLLLTMLGMLARVNQSIVNGFFPPRVFRLLVIPTLVALILAAIGVSDEFSDEASTISTGKNLYHAGIIIFAVVYLVQAGITIISFIGIRDMPQGEKRILIAVGCSLPFLLVRIIYTILVAFDTNSATFNIISGNALVQGFMSTMEEFVTVGLYLAAGLMAPKIAKGIPQTQEPGYQMTG